MHNERLERRTFLKGALASLICPATLAGEVNSAPLEKISDKGSESLVIIHLAGGNDHFNMVVPHTDRRFRAARPMQKELIRFGETAFNSNLPYLASLFRAGHLAVIESLSYEKPSRSHETASEIWLAANDGGSWFERLASLRSGTAPTVYTSPELEVDSWRSALLSADQDIVHLTFNGFDGHDGDHPHDFLLSQLDSCLSEFRRESEKNGNSLVLIYSEFGRELALNDYGGSDHGRKCTALMLGSGIKGGFYGPPALSDRWLDFRTVYATIAEHYGVSGSRLLGAQFARLSLI